MTEKVGQAQAWKWLLAGFISLAFVAARVLGAYWMQYTVNGDYAIVVLMVKRMVQGLEFPLFFYGQGYMGSLEPMLSAVLCRIYGFSEFNICMGTVTFSVAMIPFIYLLGRSAGGWQAGLAAVVYCIIGPCGFFHYTASPRGGYAALLFFTVFLLWAILEITWRELGGRRCRLLSYFGVGFAGGIAWWVDQLVSPAILAGALVYLLALRRKAFTSKGSYAAAAGFLAGLVPFIVWNIQNGWQSFEFVAHATRSVDFTKGLRFFFVRCAAILDVSNKPMYIMYPVLAVHAGAFIASLAAFVISFRKERLGLRSLGAGLLCLFIMVYAVCFSYSDLSSINTPRYLLPLVPAFGLSVGLFISLVSGWRKFAAVLLLVLLCVFQGMQLKVFVNMKKDSDLRRQQARELSEYLDRNGVRSLYGRFQEQYLNYFLNERFLVCNSGRERYLPYAEDMERAQTAAIIGGKNEVDDLLRTIGADFKDAVVAGQRVWHHIDRRTVLSADIEFGKVASVTDGRGDDFRHELFDRCLLSGWSASAVSGKPAELVVTFQEPVPVSGVRIICRPGLYPHAWSMSGRAEPGASWTEIIGNTEVSPFFWSGKRLYSKGLFYRLEGQAKEMKCRQVKLTFPAVREDVSMRISELQFFSAIAGDAVSASDIDNLAMWLERAGILRVYADRWESNQLDGLSSCRVFRDMSYTGEIQKEGIPVKLDRVTAMVVRMEDAGWTREVPSGYGVQMLETEFGPWIIFHFRDEQWNRDSTAVDGIVWVGFGAAVESHKHKGLALAKMAERAYEREGATAKVIEQMKSALQVYGNYRPGAGKLSVWLDQAGFDREAAFWRENYENMWKPSYEAPVSFGRRAYLLGVTPGKINLVPGSKFRMKYYWKCGADYSARKLGVFVHFKRGKKMLFQDDHSLLEDFDVLFQPFDEVLVEDRLITVPYDVEPGECEVWIGLVDVGAWNNRVSSKTELLKRRRSVRLPLLLHIKDK